MPSLYKRKGVYYIRYTQDGRDVRKSLGTHNRRSAEILAEKITAGVALDRLGLREFREPEKILLSEFMAQYLQNARTRKRPKTVRNSTSTLRMFLTDVGDGYMHRITPAQIEKWIDTRLQCVKPSTVWANITILRATFQMAKEWGYIRENPVPSMPRLRPRPRLAFLSLDEIERLRNTVKDNPPCSWWIEFYLHTGCRCQEVAYLEWTDIDLKRNTIRIHPKRVTAKVDFCPKTGNERTIPLRPQLRAVLEIMPQDSRWLFPSPICPDAPYTPGAIAERCKTAFQQAGLPENYSLHTLRHTFASHLVQAGMSLYIVGKLLGHSSPNMTAIYAHLAPETFESVIQHLPY